MDKNCLSYWFPRIKAAGLPVPETRIVRTKVDLTPLDGLPPGSSEFLSRLSEAADAIGYPVFLRTGHGSGKHEWTRTCCVTEPKQLGQHVYNLVEWSCMVDMAGLPTNVWAVREMLPTTPLFTAFRGMPICREFRVFVDGPEVVCEHPYWPPKALVQGFPRKQSVQWGLDEDIRQLPENFDRLYWDLCSLPEGDRRKVTQLASLAGAVLGGKWSVDVLETKRGWYLTDVAEADRSFHWDGCPHAEGVATRG